jgi:putative membrane protein
MLWLTSWIAGVLGLGFYVRGFWPAFLGALVISIVSTVLGWAVVDRQPRDYQGGRVIDRNSWR